jgi:hypothetical protein
MRDDVYTEDVADIMSCSRERGLMLAILKAWDERGLPDDFYEKGVKFAFNRSSGHVFLVNDDYEVCMLRGGALQRFYCSPYKGVEGFWDDLVPQYASMHPEDQEWMRDLAESLDKEVTDATS